MAIFQLSAIIYGRTYSVDYRYIVAPEDFTPNDLDWIEPYIFTTTRIAEALLNHPRWSLIRSERYCVFGITCRAGELLRDLNSKFIIDNSKTRHVHLFAGYVAHIPQDHNVLLPVPGYTKLDVVLFRQLYEKYVIPKWLIKDHESEQLKTLSTEYEFVLDLEPVTPLGSEATARWESLRTGLANRNNVLITPDRDEKRQQELWDIAALSHEPMSICLGLSREIDALESPFLIASAPVSEERITPRYQKTPVLELDSKIAINQQESLVEQKNVKGKGKKSTQKSRTDDIKNNRERTVNYTNDKKRSDINTASNHSEIKERGGILQMIGVKFVQKRVKESVRKGAGFVQKSAKAISEYAESVQEWVAPLPDEKEESSNPDQSSLNPPAKDIPTNQLDSSISRIGLKPKHKGEQKPEQDQQKTLPEKKEENPWDI